MENVFLADEETAKLCSEFKASTNSTERLMLAEHIARIIDNMVRKEGAVVSSKMVTEALGTPDYDMKGYRLEYIFPDAEGGYDYCLMIMMHSPRKMNFANVGVFYMDH